MPIFEYACPQCSHVFEELARPSDQEAKPCPQCGSDQTAKVPSICGRLSSGRTSEAGYAGPPPSGCAPGRGFS